MNAVLVLKIVLVTWVALATAMVADTSYARSGYARRHAAHSARKVAAPPCIKPHPSNVRAGNKIIGRDPDPFIRGEILRNFYSGWPTTPAVSSSHYLCQG